MWTCSLDFTTARHSPQASLPLRAAKGTERVFTFVRVRLSVWAVAVGPTARHPISFALAKRNGVSPKEKRPLVHIFLIAGRTLCCTCRKQLPCPSGWHVRPRRRLPRALTARLPTTSPSPGANGAFRFALTTGRHCQRRVRPAIVKIRTKRFSLTARRRFFGQAPKKWGRKGSRA